MNILKNKDIVLKFLKENPHLRDNDFKLLSNVWYTHLLNLDIKPKETTAYRLLEMLSEGKLPNSESIRRIRQKLQEEFKELRGEKYNNRHKSQKKVKEQLNSLNT